jgi:hypothetical protein
MIARRADHDPVGGADGFDEFALGIAALGVFRGEMGERRQFCTTEHARRRPVPLSRGKNRSDHPFAG